MFAQVSTFSSSARAPAFEMATNPCARRYVSRVFQKFDKVFHDYYLTNLSDRFTNFVTTNLRFSDTKMNVSIKFGWYSQFVLLQKIRKPHLMNSL
jgi:hypothetical protein